MQAIMSATIAALQSQIDKLDAQVAKSPASKRQGLIDQRDGLQGELELDRAMLDSIQKLGARRHQKQVASPANMQPGITNSSGLVGQAFDLYRQIRSMHQIDQLSNETTHIRDVGQDVRKPLHELPSFRRCGSLWVSHSSRGFSVLWFLLSFIA